MEPWQLQCLSRWISGMRVCLFAYPAGENVAQGSEIRRIRWDDVDLICIMLDAVQDCFWEGTIIITKIPSIGFILRTEIIDDFCVSCGEVPEYHAIRILWISAEAIHQYQQYRVGVLTVVVYSSYNFVFPEDNAYTFFFLSISSQ